MRLDNAQPGAVDVESQRPKPQASSWLRDAVIQEALSLQNILAGADADRRASIAARQDPVPRAGQNIARVLPLEVMPLAPRIAQRGIYMQPAPMMQGGFDWDLNSGPVFRTVKP